MNTAFKIALKLVLGLVFVLLLPYHYTLFYSLTPHTRFAGNVFYNPYQNWEGEWIKANFHAHSKLANGLTNGDNTPKEMFEVYDSLQYDLPCLSNYNTVYKGLERGFYCKAYEHGFNFGFTHQLVLGSAQVFKFDFPFYQFTSHKQFILNNLHKSSGLVVLAHPKFNASYSFSDLELLKNYHLMEIMSPAANSVAYWDKALSSGKVVWAIGNDDSHSYSLEKCGVVWTNVKVKNRSEQGVLASLKNGNCYATRGWLGQEMNELKSLQVTNNTYQLHLAHKADSINLYTDMGVCVASYANTDSISYTIKPENSYIRAEIFESEEWNAYTKMYINPVIRTQDGELPNEHSETPINWLKTGSYFLLLLGLDYLIIHLIFKKRS